MVPRRERWSDLCERLNFGQAALHFEVLESAYGQEHREYHNGRHIAECLNVFDSVREVCDYPDEVEFAIWVHDVVYWPRRTDNEEKSAELATSWLTADGVAGPTVERIYDLILATKHGDEPQTRDAAALVDIDLHILGSSPERFDEYEEQVRAEYRWVPSMIFKRRRAKLLQEFWARDPLYSTKECRDRFEARARLNLKRSLERLAG